jgi:hypothetical protein
MKDDESQGLQEGTNTLRRFSDLVMGCRIQRSIQNSISYNHISMNLWAFLAAVDNNIEPRSFEKAREKEVCVTTMKEELNVLIKDYTSDLVKLPNGK